MESLNLIVRLSVFAKGLKSIYSEIREMFKDWKDWMVFLFILICIGTVVLYFMGWVIMALS